MLSLLFLYYNEYNKLRFPVYFHFCYFLSNLHLHLISAAAAASALCQPGWVLSYKDTCLKLSESTATWHAAKSRCQSLGGDLVTLEGLQKDLFIKGWLQSEGNRNKSAFENSQAY